jgi:hypothetical protein
LEERKKESRIERNGGGREKKIKLGWRPSGGTLLNMLRVESAK